MFSLPKPNYSGNCRSLSAENLTLARGGGIKKRADSSEPARREASSVDDVEAYQRSLPWQEVAQVLVLPLTV